MKLAFTLAVLILLSHQIAAFRVRADPNDKPTLRGLTCRSCFRECNIQCFVGTCGSEAQGGFKVKQYKSTSSCYTCEAKNSLGINMYGDFTVCSADEAAA